MIALQMLVEKGTHYKCAPDRTTIEQLNNRTKPTPLARIIGHLLKPTFQQKHSPKAWITIHGFGVVQKFELGFAQSSGII